MLDFLKLKAAALDFTSIEVLLFYNMYNEPSLSFSLPTPSSLWPKKEHEAKPQNLIENIENKKHKKLKKIQHTHTSITGFEKAFEQFATAGVKDSEVTIVTGPELGNPLTPKQSDLPPEGMLEVSATCDRSI